MCESSLAAQTLTCLLSKRGESGQRDYSASLSIQLCVVSLL